MFYMLSKNVTEVLLMKKIIAAMLVGIMAVSCYSCANHSSETPSNTASKIFEDTPLELLDEVWDEYSDDEKFPAAGGDFSEENMNMDGPGKYGLSDAEALDSSFGLPADSVDKIEDAASLMHMMNANTFTCSVFRVKEDVKSSEIAGEIFDNLHDRQWVCGIPDKIVIIIVGRDVVTVFGEAELVNTFKSKVIDKYSAAQINAEENISI